MTLRTRLILALLVLALVPTVVYTLFTLDQLNRSTARWFRPGVERALESALEVSRTGFTRMEVAVLAQADEWAARLPPPPLSATQGAAVRAGLRAAGLDFFQVYRRAGRGYALAGQLVPEGVIAARPPDFSDTLAVALAGSRVIRSSRGALAAAATLADGSVVVAGMWVPPDYFSRLDDVGRGTGYYRRLGVVVPVQQRFLWLLVGALGLVLLALAALLATQLARAISRPLRELSAALGRVAAGEPGVSIVPRGALELRSLGEAFNAMTERLAAAREQLKQAEREAAWREVARHLAHEIKNPLTPMRLSLHRLERRFGSIPETEREAVHASLQALLQEVEHLSRLAEQFSQYARLPEPRFEPIDLREVVRDAVHLHEPESVRLAREPAQALSVWGDRLLLSRAVHNLLLNACEASPAGAAVEVVIAAEGPRAVVEVLDRGPGVPENLRDRLFEPYVSTKARGSGLGLTLVRDVARQHGGTVTLENREGGGARARLALPLIEEGGRAAADG